MSTTAHEKPRPARTPLTRAVRRVVDAVEDVVDDVMFRGEGIERDSRQLLNNLVKEREDEPKKGRHEKSEE